MLALAVSAMALGLLVGCEDKQAELQQNSRIDAISSEVIKLRNDLEEVKIENQRLTGKINLVTGWLAKKVEEEKARAAAKTATSTATPAGDKAADKTTTAKTPAKTGASAPAKTGTASTAAPKTTDAAKKKTNP